jgi:hypothetical protein
MVVSEFATLGYMVAIVLFSIVLILFMFFKATPRYETPPIKTESCISESKEVE